MEINPVNLGKYANYGDEVMILTCSDLLDQVGGCREPTPYSEVHKVGSEHRTMQWVQMSLAQKNVQTLIEDT